MKSLSTRDKQEVSNTALLSHTYSYNKTSKAAVQNRYNHIPSSPTQIRVQI